MRPLFWDFICQNTHLFGLNLNIYCQIKPEWHEYEAKYTTFLIYPAVCGCINTFPVLRKKQKSQQITPNSPLWIFGTESSNDIKNAYKVILIVNRTD